MTATCSLPTCNAAASHDSDKCWRHRPRIQLKRYAPIKAVNTKRKARIDKETFGLQADYCRRQRCCCCYADPPSDPHHVRSRGAGGKDDECVPLCRECHSMLHAHGRSALEAKYSIDLDSEKRRMQRESGE